MEKIVHTIRKDRLEQEIRHLESDSMFGFIEAVRLWYLWRGVPNFFHHVTALFDFKS